MQEEDYLLFIGTIMIVAAILAWLIVG